MDNCIRIMLAIVLHFNNGVIGSDKKVLEEICKMKSILGNLFPHPSDCHKYVQCSYGTPYEMRCPKGLFFNPTAGICDYKNNVNCKGNPCNNNNGGCHQKCLYINHNSYACDCDSGYKLDRNNDHKTCIQGSINMKTYCQGKHGQQLPDPRTCDGFIKCVGDNSIAISCGTLKYNEAAQTCDHAWSANCKGRDFTAWAEWSQCFKPESDGYCIQKRNRTCSSDGSTFCEGWASEIRPCKMDSCTKAKVDPCALQNGGCMDQCTNEGGKAVCSCRDGRQLANDKKSCTTGRCGVAPLRDDSIISFIISGQGAVRGSYPWQVAIYTTQFDEDDNEEKVFHCGGSLIDDKHVLSAAHCFPKFTEDEIKGVTVVLGEHNRNRTEGTEKFLKVKDIYVHKNYNEFIITNDIAILTLSEEVTFSDYIAPICLPEENEELRPGTSCRVTGWGDMFNDGEKAQVLQEITVPVVEESICKKKNKVGAREVTNNMICTGYDDGATFKSACRGDSGGPLSCMINGVWRLYGIVSWGDSQCNALNRYNVFTKVAKYMTWINENNS